MFTVEVIYATLEKQELISIQLNHQCTIEEVINKSGILDKCPEIDLLLNKVGIYNQLKKLTDLIADGDRVEIYRPLIANPKEVRRKRAIMQKQQGIIK